MIWERGIQLSLSGITSIQVLRSGSSKYSLLPKPAEWMGTIQLCSYSGQDIGCVTSALCDISILLSSSEAHSLFRYIVDTMNI